MEEGVQSQSKRIKYQLGGTEDPQEQLVESARGQRRAKRNCNIEKTATQPEKALTSSPNTEANNKAISKGKAAYINRKNAGSTSSTKKVAKDIRSTPFIPTSGKDILQDSSSASTSFMDLHEEAQNQNKGMKHRHWDVVESPVNPLKPDAVASHRTIESTRGERQTPVPYDRNRGITRITNILWRQGI